MLWRPKYNPIISHIRYLITTFFSWNNGALVAPIVVKLLSSNCNDIWCFSSFSTLATEIISFTRNLLVGEAIIVHEEILVDSTITRRWTLAQQLILWQVINYVLVQSFLNIAQFAEDNLLISAAKQHERITLSQKISQGVMEVSKVNIRWEDESKDVLGG